MSKVINCECGEVVTAETDEELVGKVERHVGEAHPELGGEAWAGGHPRDG